MSDSMHQKHSSLETTAALEEAHAANPQAASVISRNASQEQHVAEDAASVARTRGENKGAQTHPSQRDTATNTSNMNRDSINAASKKLTETPDSVLPAHFAESRSIAGTIQETASAAVATTGEYLQAAKDVAAPTLTKIMETAQGYIAGMGVATPPMPSSLEEDSGILSTSAPLESGKHQVNGPYPTTTGADGSTE